MRILFIGDIFAYSGRQAVYTWLKDIKKEHSIDFCIANAENASHGRGITRSGADEIYASGVNFITLGNHTWSQRETFSFIDDFPMIRPANFPKNLPGRGYDIINTEKGSIGVVNLLGRVYMDLCDNPFDCVMDCILKIREITNTIIIDFHAEATSEKKALAMYTDGLISAVIGTHTHVQTADEQILPGGTAFITDVGMTGPVNGIIGMNAKCVMDKFVSLLPSRFEPAKGDFMLNAVVVDIDSVTGKANSIYRITKR